MHVLGHNDDEDDDDENDEDDDEDDDDENDEEVIHWPIKKKPQNLSITGLIPIKSHSIIDRHTNPPYKISHLQKCLQTVLPTTIA